MCPPLLQLPSAGIGEQCGPGHYVDAAALSQGTPCNELQCSAGWSDTDSDEGTACEQCPAGHYMAAGHAGPCTPCPPGLTDHDGSAATPCIACAYPVANLGVGRSGQCAGCGCKNGGRCFSGGMCDCTGTGFGGHLCELPLQSSCSVGTVRGVYSAVVAAPN